MCRIEERVYIGSDGRRQVFEDTFPCDKSHRGKLCSKVKRKTTEYFSKPPAATAHDHASSPTSTGPSTPTGTGSYLVEQRRPSQASQRPSTQRDRQRTVRPEIVIEFGSKKNKGKTYDASKTYKRSSLGSITSNDMAIDSPASGASDTIRTGFPEAPVPPAATFGQAERYTTRHAVPQAQHRHTSSSSSHTTSSQPPSLYATSESESMSSGRLGRQSARYPPALVHNPIPGVAPTSPGISRAAAVAPSSRSSSGQSRPTSVQYGTTIVSPHSSSRDNVGIDGLSPHDYSDFTELATSSRISSARAAAPEITDRAIDRELRRKRKDDERRAQEEADRRLAEEFAKLEDTKQVRFELDRATDRERQRNEAKFAESEKRRAEERDTARRQTKEQEGRATKKPEREKTKPPTRDFNKRPGHSRRPSMTQADVDKRNSLLAETEAQMARERARTEERERDERLTSLRQQQETSQYWDPRGGDRYPMTNNASAVGRRNSVTRRGSVSSNAPPTGLGRTSSNRRVSIHQNAPPANLQHQYATRPPSSHLQNAPKLPCPGYSTSTARPPSARHSSCQQENPFAQPPTRTSNTSQENPFAMPPTRNVHLTQAPPALSSPPGPGRDPWDVRGLGEALPRSASQRQQPTSLQRRGEQVVNRSGDRAHGRAQQATLSMGRAVGFEDDYETSSSEDDKYEPVGYGTRPGLDKGKRRG